MATALCANPLCQQPFVTKQSYLNRGRRMHCSHACRWAVAQSLLAQRTSKKCPDCGEEKPLDAFYLRKTGRQTGKHASRCKPCNTIAASIFREKDPEQERLRLRDYRLTHQEHLNANTARWRKDHPEKVAAYRIGRRARKAHAPVNDFTAEQWLEVQEAFAHRCAYCGKRAKGRLTQDHISALGPEGPHTLHNIVPACRSCNAKKSTGPPLVPIQPLLFTFAPAKPLVRRKR